MNDRLRNYRELKLAEDDGQEVDQDLKRIFGVEASLLRFAMEKPRAAMQSVKAQMLNAPDYRVAWQAIEKAIDYHDGDGPLSPANVATEMARIEQTRFGGHFGRQWMDDLMVESLVEQKYALGVLARDVVSLHQMRQWNGRIQSLSERIIHEKEPAALREEWITESYRISTEPDTGASGRTTTEAAIAWDPIRHPISNIVPTGFAQIDRASGGGPGRGDMMVVGGGTSHGKTVFLQVLARHQARLAQPCLYVSAEDPEDLLTCRNIAAYSDPPISPADIRQAQAPPDIVESAKEALAREQKDFVRCLYFKKPAVSTLCAAIRRHRYLHNIKMAIVDYLQAVEPDESTNNKVQDTAIVVSSLKKTCADVGVVLVLASQYSREEYKRGEEPSINACRWAGDIENESDIMFLLWRDEDDVLHGKLAKLKWSSSKGRRYLISQHHVTGALLDWEDDFTEPARRDSHRRGRGAAAAE